MKNLPNIKIALVDDDNDEKFIFQKALDELKIGYDFFYYKCPNEFLVFLESKAINPDIVFIDMHMPQKNGLELVQEMRKNKDLDFIKSVIYSHSVSPLVIQAFKSLGTTDFIIKPPDISAMKAIIKKLIDTLVKVG